MDDVVGPNYTSFFPFYALLTTVIMKNFGRQRQSIVDIEQELHDIFRGHPQCSNNSEGVASLPAKCLPDVFDTYQEEYGVELLAKDEMASFMQIVDDSPDLEATPDIILQLVAMRTSSSQQIDSEDHTSTPAGTVAVWMNVTTKAATPALLAMAVAGRPVVLAERHVHLARKSPRLTRRSASEAHPLLRLHRRAGREGPLRLVAGKVMRVIMAAR
jgi:hypothetical protein